MFCKPLVIVLVDHGVFIIIFQGFHLNKISSCCVYIVVMEEKSFGPAIQLKLSLRFLLFINNENAARTSPRWLQSSVPHFIVPLDIIYFCSLPTTDRATVGCQGEECISDSLQIFKISLS